jgi:hypothetical protein
MKRTRIESLRCRLLQKSKWGGRARLARVIPNSTLDFLAAAGLKTFQRCGVFKADVS